MAYRPTLGKTCRPTCANFDDSDVKTVILSLHQKPDLSPRTSSLYTIVPIVQKYAGNPVT